jgi:hypothetical protein
VDQDVVGAKVRAYALHHLAEGRGRYDGEQEVAPPGDVFDITGGFDQGGNAQVANAMGGIDFLHKACIAGVQQHFGVVRQKVGYGGSEGTRPNNRYGLYRFFSRHGARDDGLRFQGTHFRGHCLHLVP